MGTSWKNLPKAKTILLCDYPQESNLHLNRLLMVRDHWDEDGIAERGQLFFDVAVKLWPGPES
jgi:hypothetical protein